MTEATDALELIFRGQEETVAYACPKCGHLVTPESFQGQSELAKDYAKNHCLPPHCEKCNAPVRQGRIICDDCWKKSRAEQDSKKYELSRKIAESDYFDTVYWEGHEGSMGDGYFANIEELRDYCEQIGIDPPFYVWSCTPVRFDVSVENLLEDAFQEHYEGARDQLAEGAEEELEKLLVDWCTKQDIKSWRVDYRRAIILDPQEPDDLLQEAATSV